MTHSRSRSLKVTRCGPQRWPFKVRTQNFPITSLRGDIPRREGHRQFSSRLYSQCFQQEGRIMNMSGMSEFLFVFFCWHLNLRGGTSIFSCPVGMCPWGLHFFTDSLPVEVPATATLISLGVCVVAAAAVALYSESGFQG